MNTLTIGIVEDNPVHRRAYANMIRMEAQGHQLKLYENAQSLLMRMSELATLDCLLLDIMLPDESGFVLAERIRSDCPCLPIIFITAYSDEAEAIKALSAGADDYLPKGDYNPVLLMRSIRYAIERRKFLFENQLLADNLERQRSLYAQQREFAAIISHEFRTPLAIISSSAQLMQRKWKSGEQESMQRHFNKIDQAIDRLHRIMENALYFSRMEEGHVTFRPHPFDVRGLIDEIIGHCEQMHPEYRFESDCMDLPEMFLGDASICEHVLSNLLSNAVKYSTPEQGPIRLSATTQASHILIRVEDQGRGISDADQRRLGERFFRGQNTTDTAGTGIGLHIVKTLVQMHGGHIAFTSAPDKGTCATLSLPLVPLTHRGRT